MTSTISNMHALDQLLLERFGGKVGRGLALEYSQRRAHSRRLESLFTPVLTVCSQGFVARRRECSMTVKSRLERVEAAARGGRCERCGLSEYSPGRIALRDDGSPREGFPDDPEERCDSCGRPLWCVIEIVYEDAGGTRE